MAMAMAMAMATVTALREAPLPVLVEEVVTAMATAMAMAMATETAMERAEVPRAPVHLLLTSRPTTADLAFT